MFILFEDWWEGESNESRSFLLSLPPSLFDLSSSRVIFPLERIDNTRLQHTWNTKLLLFVVDTRWPALREIASLISPLPPPVRGLIICGRRVISWSRGRNNNNAGNVSPKNRWGIRENSVAWLWRRARSLDGAFVPRSFQAMGKFVVEEWRGRGRTIRCRRALMFRYKSSLDYTLDYIVH